MCDPVVCSCGWRGRRKWAPCECDCEMGCCRCGPRVGYGACARCGRRGLETPAEARERKKIEAETEAFWASEEGKAVGREVQS